MNHGPLTDAPRRREETFGDGETFIWWERPCKCGRVIAAGTEANCELVFDRHLRISVVLDWPRDANGSEVQ